MGDSAEPVIYERVGAKSPWNWNAYLTPEEQTAFTRVSGGNLKPTKRLASMIRNQAWVNLWANLAASICGLAAVIGIVSPALPNAPLLQVIAVATVLLLVVFMLGSIFIHYRRHPWIPGQSTTLLLIRSVRELETTGNHRALCLLLDRTANDFFGEFRRPPGIGRNAPRRYRARWEAEAALGAHAIASQAERLLQEPLDTAALADDLRRMIIRIGTGYWQQVKDLDASQGADLWTPPGIGRRIAAFLRNEVTWKGLATGLALIISTLSIIGTVRGWWAAPPKP